MYHKNAAKYNISSPSSRTMQQPPAPIITVNSQSQRILTTAFIAYLFFPVFCIAQTNATDSLSILFLGTSGRHQSSMFAEEFIPVMAARGIDLTYTDNLEDLNAATLAKYDGLIIYADSVKVDPALVNAILDYVASGKGFIAIHCAVGFLESPKYKELIGAQFKYHSTGKFRTSVINANHPILKDFHEFETWDETYVHTKPSPDCTVLLVRREGDRDEPVTWVRTHGKGRVFYTACGHDIRTWNTPGFQSLIERGIRWSCGSTSFTNSSPEMDIKMAP